MRSEREDARWDCSRGVRSGRARSGREWGMIRASKGQVDHQGQRVRKVGLEEMTREEDEIEVEVEVEVELVFEFDLHVEVDERNFSCCASSIRA